MAHGTVDGKGMGRCASAAQQVGAGGHGAGRDRGARRAASSAWLKQRTPRLQAQRGGGGEFWTCRWHCGWLAATMQPNWVTPSRALAGWEGGGAVGAWRPPTAAVDRLLLH